MDIEKLFITLESNNSQEYEDTKKKFAEFFSQTKEQWIVQGMLDYYLITNSARIIDILVKVQPPHDTFIFDRLSDWLRGPNRIPSLTVFGFIVRKHPTWLYKVAKHRLMKDILKLLQTEKEIISLMSALLSIVTLLPIIPSLVPNFLSDLFDVFGYLALSYCQNPAKLHENQLIHLQIGLYMLFHRLYGMYPCHFISYLREFKDKEKGAIFYHIIKPLLETVRIHPLLVIGTKESEINGTRWKEMEPHDVVVECAKFSLDYYQDNQDCFAASFAALRSQEPISSACEIPISQQLQSSLPDSQFQQSVINSHSSFLNREIVDMHNVAETIWSPSIDILATPPPTAGTVPHTPTPSYGVPTNYNSSGGNLLGATGASPPEAAVEATPETTPMKDINLKQRTTITANSPAIRAILPSSQPSSPMRKEHSPFNFPDSSSGNIFTSATTSTSYNIEQTTTTTTKITASQRRLIQLMNDRNQMTTVLPPSLVVPKQLVGQSSLPTELEDIQRPIEDLQHNQQYYNNSKTILSKPAFISSSLDSPTNYTDNSTQDDQTTSQQQIFDGPHHSDTLLDITNEYDDADVDDDDETERSLCSTSGLHVPSNRFMQIVAQGIRKERITNCYNDNSSYLSYGVSPAYTNGISDISYIQMIDNAKVRRAKSWHGHDSNDFISKINQKHKNNIILPQSNALQFQQQNGDSSSPSCDDAISAATHFKKKEQKIFCQQQQLKQSHGQLKNPLLLHGNNNNSIQQHPQNLNSFQTLNHNNIDNNHQQNYSHQRQHIQTQTVDTVPQVYELSLFELCHEDVRLHNVFSKTSSLSQHLQPSGVLATAATTEQIANSLEKSTSTVYNPIETLQQYIEHTITMKQSFDSRNREEALKEQIQLLNLQLQFERHRREIHSERNRRLLGKSRELRSLQLDNYRLRDQLNKLHDELTKITIQCDKIRCTALDKEYELKDHLNGWKAKYQNELEENKKLHATIEQLQRRLNDEKRQGRDMQYEIETLHGEIFDLRNDMQQVQFQAELGTQYKNELTKLEAEFLCMSEIQIKLRDRLMELDNQKAKEDEILHMQEVSSDEVRDLRNVLENRTAQLEAVKHKLNEIQTQLFNKEAMFTDQKRLLKSVKEEYEEKFKALNNKYEVQKAIILSMEQTIFELYKSQSAVNLPTFSSESDKIDIAGSVDHTSPLSISLASSEGLSASLRSVPELRNLQALVVQPTNTASGNTTQNNIITTTPATISPSSSNIASYSVISSQKQPHQQQLFKKVSNFQQLQQSSSNSSFFPTTSTTNQQQQELHRNIIISSPSKSNRNTRASSNPPLISSSTLAATVAATATSTISSHLLATSIASGNSGIGNVSGSTRHMVSSSDIPVPGSSQQKPYYSNLQHHR